MTENKYQHTIQHTVLRNFWPMALEKPTRGKPVKERERVFIKLLGKNQTFIYSQNPTYLNPVGCLIFCANAALISVQCPFPKTMPNQQQTQPGFLCRMRNILPSIFVPKTAENPYSMDSIKWCHTASKIMPVLSANFMPKTALENCAKSVLYGLQ